MTSVPAGVEAAHDGTSSVTPKPGRTHGEVQVPTPYRLPATVVVRVGVVIRSLPVRPEVPAKLPVRRWAAESQCR